MSLLSDAEKIAAGFSPLSLSYMPAASQLPAGVRGVHRTGIGNDFWQFRNYSFGDPAPRIDWRQSARSEAIYVRERERVAPHTVWLWCDKSASMQFNSEPHLPTKFYAGARLAVAIAKLFCQAEELVSVLGTPLPPRFHSAQLGAIAYTLQNAADTESLPPLPPNLSARNFMLLISDFGAAPETIFTRLESYAAAGVTACLVQMLDPLENDFPLQGRIHVYGLENEGDEIIDNAKAQQHDYLARLGKLQNDLKTFCRKHRWGWMPTTTAQAPAEQLAKLYNIIHDELA